MGYRITLEDKARLQALHQLLTAEPGRPWTQSLLCRETGLNRTKVCRGFHLLYDCTPFTYLLHRRMELAYELLKTTDHPTKLIAAKAGYRNVKSFHRAFRQHFGCTTRPLRPQVV